MSSVATLAPSCGSSSTVGSVSIDEVKLEKFDSDAGSSSKPRSLHGIVPVNGDAPAPSQKIDTQRSCYFGACFAFRPKPEKPPKKDQQPPCDMHLLIFDRDFPVHKDVLCKSPYFRAMLKGPWSESKSQSVQLVLDDPNITLEAMILTIDFLYGRDIQMAPYQPFQLLAASAMLQLDDLAARCVVCIAEFLSPHTFIDAAEFAIHYCQPNLLDHCLRWLKWHLVHNGTALAKKWIPRPSVCTADWSVPSIDTSGMISNSNTWIKSGLQTSQGEKRTCTSCDLVLDGQNVLYHNRKLSMDVFKDLIASDEARRARFERPEDGSEPVQCYIKRVKDPKNKNLRKYYLHLQSNDELLLVARKRRHAKTSEFAVSIDGKDVSRHGGAYIGNMRSNFLGTQYAIYDKGFNPDEIDPTLFPLPERQELALILYQVNLLGVRGPRKMTVMIPRVNEDKSRVSFTTDGIRQRYRANDLSDLLSLRNKAPLWSEQLNAYTLNFYGRVKMASKKNFQLIYPDNPDQILLMFGKVDADTFTLDYRHPLSCLQAFCIALSSFDHKLAVS